MPPPDELSLALSHAERGDRTLAREALRRALEASPRSVIAHLVAAGIDSALRPGQHVDRWCARAIELARVSDDRKVRLVALDTAAMLGLRHGWYREARAWMEETLALDPAAPRHRALSDLLRRTRSYDGAVEHARRVLALGPSAADCVRTVDLLLECERAGDALPVLDQALALSSRARPEESARVLADVAQREVRVGTFERAFEHLDRAVALHPGNVAAWALRATLHLWRIDLDEASRCAREALALDANCREALRVRAAVAVLRERYDEALADLDAVIARDGRDAEAWLWRAEALLRMGRADEALLAAQTAGERSPEFTQYVAAQVVRFLAMIQKGTFRHLPRGVLEEVLTALCPDEPHALHAAFPHPPEIDEDPARIAHDTARVLERALAALGGNRSFTPSWISPYDDAPTFRTIALSMPPRTVAKEVLARVVIDDPATVLAAFEPVLARYPRRDEPHLYVGELFLYAGRYPEARAAFQRALACNPTARWAFIGLGAVDLCEGKLTQALATWERGVRVAGGEGPTLHVYRGETFRRLGRMAEARRDLEVACASRPARISAWVNLALVHDVEGDRAAFDVVVERLRRDAPELLADAANEASVVLPDPGEVMPAETARTVLETSLVMMRGNRSSTHATWVLADGRWRAAPTGHGARGDGVDAQLLRQMRALLGRG